MYTFSIKSKVLILLLILTIIMIVGMALNIQSGFNQGFFNYRKAVDNQFNKSLVKTLEKYFFENNNWDELEYNRKLWHELVNISSVEPIQQHRLRLPPAQKIHFKSNDNETKSRRNPDSFGPRRNLKDHNRPRLLPPVAIFNINKEYITGMNRLNQDDLIYHEIKNKDSIVGYLGTEKNNQHYRVQDELFVKNITSMLFKVGLIMVAFALLITFPIATYFTKIINQISHATQKISAGDFSTRIHSDRKDELGVLVKNVNSLAKSLELSAKSQKTMIADIAHELRTPIAVIVGEIEAIQDGIHIADVKTLNLLHTQISSLKNLVNDLYKLSESDRGALKYKMKEMDLVELVNQCLKSFDLMFEQKQISCKINKLPKTCKIIGDYYRLNQLFNNLLKNSVTYTDKGGTVQLSVNQLQSTIQISLEDSSPSLNKEQLNKIFKRWYRAEKSRNKNLGGSGLGLAICKEIVKAHDGTINAKQSSLGGVEIIINLPIKV